MNLKKDLRINNKQKRPTIIAFFHYFNNEQQKKMKKKTQMIHPHTNYHSSERARLFHTTLSTYASRNVINNITFDKLLSVD
jgi:hypothetical protein